MKLNYFASETVSNLRRNLLMTVAAISTVAISLLLLGGALILGKIVSNVTKSWEAKVEISAFLTDGVTDGEVEQLQAQLLEMPEVEDVQYVSKAQAFEDYREIFKNQPHLIVPGLEDALPASLRVKLVDAKYTEQVAASIEGAAGVEEVNDGGAIIRRLLQVNSLLRTVTFATSLILMIAAAGLIANSIRLAIYARRDEIAIMKLVGATNWFIRIPFMFEGVFSALVGAILSGAVVLLADRFLFSRVGDWLLFLGPIFSFSNGEILSILATLLGVGTVVGLLGSGMALRRFLEV